jgi:tetratricopeptide (TPR) repeat protein
MDRNLSSWPCGLLLPALVTIALACGCAQQQQQAPTLSQPTIRPITLPDVSTMEKPVQDQLREAYASLMAKVESGQTSSAELATAYGEMGNLLLAAEYFDAAEPCYRNAQELAPQEMRWAYYLGHVHRLRGEPANAASAFERTLELAPSDVATLVWLGNVYLDQGMADAAESLFTKALTLQPRTVAALVGQGRAALAQHQFSRATETLERALTLDPRAAMAQYPLALAYRGLGDVAKAEEHMKRRGEVEVGPPDPLMQAIAGLLHSAVSYEKQGLRALDGGDAAAAAAAFRRAIEVSPNQASLHHRLGTALSLTGDNEGAAKEFEEAIRRSPGHAAAHFSLGVLLASSGRDQEAVERFTAAVRAEPSYAEARLLLAGALIRLRRYNEAHDQLVEGAKRNPDRPEFARGLEQFRLRPVQ